uniref:Uncharacterized protein n=1 Tax=Romanomermis culicivorax TaxID=13658 RepID=A0A915JHB5_ROMCU
MNTPHVLSFLLLIAAIFVSPDDPPRCQYHPGNVQLLFNSDRIGKLPVWALSMPTNTIAANMSRISDQAKIVPPPPQCGTTDGITLEYRVAASLPLKRFKIVTKVLKGSGNCLQGDPSDPKYETVSNVEPESVAFVHLDLRNLTRGEEAYLL